MTTEEVSSYRDLNVGDEVSYCPDAGFAAGVIHKGKIARILITRWDPEEAATLQVPAEEVLVLFANGATAHCSYDKIRPQRKGK